MKSVSNAAEILERERKALRLTYQQLADATGLSVPSVREAVKGISAPRLTTAMVIADKLGLEFVLVPKVVARGLEQDAQAPLPPVTLVDRILSTAPQRSSGTGRFDTHRSKK
jgi:transcriptional regulator with XRE-family HTH domain